jgi:hypothetical protein
MTGKKSADLRGGLQPCTAGFRSEPSLPVAAQVGQIFLAGLRINQIDDE